MDDVRILDVTSDDFKKSYEENLKKLISNVKKSGFIDRFVLIRNDNFFPQDFVWRINLDSESKFFASYKKVEKVGLLERLFKIKNVESKIEDFRMVCPTKFRSTKHFTVNTPLNLTTEYNNVTLDRTFTIIDGIDNFLNSGYAYSLSDRDAYLDISHEGLQISSDAVILIPIEKYQEIRENKELMEMISKRKLVIFKGDMSLAINSFLVENGILPFRSKIVEYDDELKGVIEGSMKALCSEYNLKYNLMHSALDGHFSSLIDQYAQEDKLIPLIDYFNSIFKDNQINLFDLKKHDFWQTYIDSIGYDAFINTLNAYNKMKKKDLLLQKEKYILERKKITPEVSFLFKSVVKLIVDNQSSLHLQNEDDEVTKNIISFFSAMDLKTQIKSGEFLMSKLKENESEKVR